MLLALALAHLQVAPGPPLTDPRLDRPLAVEARIEPLPDLVARIGREVGVSLTVERRMESLKATVFTPARSARLTLAGLASVFEAEWTAAKGGGYQLAEIIPARGRREMYLKREAEIERAGAEARLTKRVDLPEFVPTGNAAGDKERQREVEHQTRQVPAERLIVAAYARLSPAERERFWRGELLHSVGRSEGQAEERTRTKGENGEGDRLEIVRHPAGLNLTLIRYTPGGLGLRTYVRTPDGRGSSGAGGSLAPEDATLSDHPFRKSQREWATDLASKAPQWALPLKPMPMPVEPTRWAQGVATSSDVLGEIHRRCGLPIVAEANRRIIGRGLVVGGTTLGEELRSGMLGGDAFRLESGALLSRPREFWRMRLVEPPEAVLAPFEREPVPTLDSVATLYARLSPATLANWFPGLPPFASIHDLAPKASRDRFSNPNPTLRLWGRLDSDLRDRLERGETIPLAALPPEVRGAVQEATVDAVFEGVTVSSSEPMAELPTDVTASSISISAPQPATGLIGLLGFGPGGARALSATVARGSDSPERRSVQIRITDDRGNSLAFPEAGPY